ncbi:MAG: hypothetical protein ACM3PP_04025 [Candidatus Saccharibacteria bacterium]
MKKNQAINESLVKANVQKLYALAEKLDLIPNLIAATGVANESSLRWTYQNGRISENQINGYSQVFSGIERAFLTGEKPLTVDDLLVIENSINGQILSLDNALALNSALVAVVPFQQLAILKNQYLALIKQIEIRELLESPPSQP